MPTFRGRKEIAPAIIGDADDESETARPAGSETINAL